MRSALVGLLFLASLPAVGQTPWRGNIAAEYRYFSQDALDRNQKSAYSSFVAQPELHIEWDQNRQSLTVAPFYRWDQYDRQRTHGDIRELLWLYVGDGFEARLGVRKVFWGVAESQHLVDVINQTDLVENPDGKEKLGQPMASAKLFTPLGTWEMFLLPYFRERTFPGQAGRLRTALNVDTAENALYQSGSKRKHVDYALRWAQTIDAWDIGISHFSGTNRDPQFAQAVNRKGESVLLPYYDLMHQTGLDVQATLNNWLLKLEAIRRTSTRETYRAATLGFEYTFYQVGDSPLNVGLVAEYLYDSRRRSAPTPFNDDVMLGLRLTPNDIQGTEFLLGVIADRRTSARIYSLEASRRLNDHVKLGVAGRMFSGADAQDPLYSFRRDNYVQMKLSYSF